jgi:nucleoside-diphosphate-sugar epimerase
MRVLATGTEGYVGALLPGILVASGHEVVGVDTGYYASAELYEDAPRAFERVSEDIRSLQSKHFEGVDAVVHLAELSNDPLGQLLPDITYEVNHRGSVHVASLAKAAGVERFVYASSCSIYGVADQEVVDEESPVAPQTAYAECKTFVERDLRALADDSFSPTFLRFATAYGASPRIRFDVVLNNLAGLAWTTGEITMESDGTPWRPLVHVRDMCGAVAAALEAPRENVHSEVLNVGAPGANYRIKDIAEIVGEVFEGCEISIGATSPDNRSYRVSFDKIHDVLPAFACEWDPRRGAKQLLDVFRQVDLTPADFLSPKFTRLKQIEHLLATGAVDRSLFWTDAAAQRPSRPSAPPPRGHSWPLRPRSQR